MGPDQSIEIRRRRSGTRIQIVLRAPLANSQLTELVRRWCRRVEFPIHIREFGTETTVTAERKEQFLYEISDIMTPGAKFAVRPFNIQRNGIEGELYVFTRVDDKGESWDAWSDACYRYPMLDPRALKPVFPDSLYCIHGIRAQLSGPSGPRSERLDFRGGNIPVPSLSREHLHFAHFDTSDDRVLSRWTEILSAHLADSKLANSSNGWRYKQALADDFPPGQFWDTVTRTIPIHVKREIRLASLEEVLPLPVIATTMAPQEVWGVMFKDRESAPQPIWEAEIPAIFAEELSAFSKRHRIALFRGRYIESVNWLPSEHLVIYWKMGDVIGGFGGPSHRPSILGALNNSFTIGFKIYSMSDSGLESDLFNSASPLIQWMLRVKKAASEGTHGLSADHFSRLHELLHGCCRFGYEIANLATYLEKWRDFPDLPDELLPPTMEIIPQMFLRVPEPQSGRAVHKPRVIKPAG